MIGIKSKRKTKLIALTLISFGCAHSGMSQGTCRSGYDGPGGPAYSGFGGPCYNGLGGGGYTGFGGPAYAGLSGVSTYGSKLAI